MKISIIICTLNEELNIRSRIDNINNLELPSNDINVDLFILDNGSNDKTSDIVKSEIIDSKFDLKLIKLPSIGKCGSLFWAFENICCDYFILSDANTYFKKDVLINFVSRFKQHQESSVFIGNFKSCKSYDSGLDFFETSPSRFSLRLLFESKIGIFSGANGACYAVSKKSVEDIYKFPAVRNDDFVISVFASSKGGIIFDNAIMAFEVENFNLVGSFKQKFRDSLGHYQAINWLYKNCKYWKIPVFFRLSLWFVPILAIVTTLTLFMPKSLIAVAFLFIKKIRILIAKMIALLIGFFSGFINRPSVNWNVDRS